MLDYLKIRFDGIDYKKLLKSKKFDFKGNYSVSTGEIYDLVLKARYHHCEIVIRKTGEDTAYVQFSGSIHKMWNSIHGLDKFNNSREGFNGNQFNLENLLECRKILEELFDCKPEQMIFENVEFGVNAEIGFDPKLFLNGLLYHHSIPFESKFKEHYFKANHQQFKFKIYNKSSQYNLPNPVLRIELKFKKMIALKAMGISTFKDITVATFEKLSNELLKRFDEIMHYDYTIDKSSLGKNSTALISNYSNPRYWLLELAPNHRDRHKKNLQRITAKHSKNLRGQIRAEIIKKCVINNRLEEIAVCNV